MRAFYVDLKRGERFLLLAGPFKDEAVARKYERPAFDMAVQRDPLAAFDSYGVVSIDDHFEPGKLNARLDIDPDDLMTKADIAMARDLMAAPEREYEH